MLAYCGAAAQLSSAWGGAQEPHLVAASQARAISLRLSDRDFELGSMTSFGTSSNRHAAVPGRSWRAGGRSCSRFAHMTLRRVLTELRGIALGVRGALPLWRRWFRCVRSVESRSGVAENGFERARSRHMSCNADNAHAGGACAWRRG